MEKQELVPQKKVTVFSTLGKNAQEFTTAATTWGELQSGLKEMNISFSGMKAVIGENKHTLESDKALLPTEGFTLYLMPVKTKSGADRKELMATIKDFVIKNPSRKQDFIIDGKNMTQLSTAVIEGLVAKHISGDAATAAPKAEAVKAPKETPAAKAAPDVIIESLVGEIENTLSDSKHKVKVMTAVAQIVALLGGNLEVAVGKKEAAAPSKPEAPAETESQKAAREERERKAELNKRLAREAEDMMSEFKDVNR
jgi:hypothetical protein